jgi:two-component system, chemotaxis family, sensor kinase CheA
MTSGMDLDFGLMLQTFLAEAEEHLGDLEEGLLALEARAADEEAVHALFRAAHTIKGGAATMGFTEIVEYAHALEEILLQLRKKTMAPSPGLATLLLHAADALRQMVNAKANLSPTDLAALADALAQAQGVEGAVTARTEAAPTVTRGPERLRTLRVGVDRLDRLLELTGEIAVARGRVSTMLAQIGEPGVAALAAHHDADRLNAELQERVLAARLVPVGPLLRRYSHAARDAASRQGKRVAFRVDGANVLVDTTVMEAVRDPLTHLVRNAVDHGVEAPEARQARGKEPCGQITLRARGEARTVVFEVSDDGDGVDLERVAARARALGLLGAGERASDDLLQHLIFQPGLSTAAQVTESSGRGVGLDVVRRNIEALHGSVEVTSARGKGTTVTLRLPLTLAVVEGLAVGAAGETYLIPLDAVAECQDLARDSGGVVYLRGQPVPVLRLREVLGAPGRAGHESLVILRHGSRRAGVAVDQLVGRCEAVIRPLGPLLRTARGILGSTILGSGRVALVLDVAALLREASARTPGGTPS